MRIIVDNPREQMKHFVGVRISTQLPELPLEKVDPAVYVGYVGQYRAALLGCIPVGPTLNVYRTHDEVGEHLMASVEAIADEPIIGELFPSTKTAFFIPDAEDVSVSFRPNSAGKATGILVRLPDMDIRAIRVSDRPNIPVHD
jgi:hypothetical protein